ncbi:hypothetical protein MKX78_24270 [Cytobacillus sp. FSL R5-0569]|uniref:hypothetical protein n=1 Tax=Cytobacillus sp. FSL R5-0569 TaxID=2921649 RepID=UPI0030F72C6A
MDQNLKRVLNIYGVFLLISWILVFIINQETYTRSETVEGIGFICVVLAIYFILVNLYHKSKFGQKVVVWSLGILFVINCICFFIVY